MSVIYTHYTVMPISTLDKPVGGTDYTVFTDFVRYDTNGNAIGRYTLPEYIAELDTNRVLEYSTDGEYFAFGWNFSDLNNQIVNLKQLMSYYGYVLGGEDFTNIDPLAYWVLNADEYIEWKSVSPHNVIPIV